MENELDPQNETEDSGITSEKKEPAALVWERTSPTPYDDVFRTLEQELRRLYILFLNLMFGTSYTGTERVTREATEIMIVGVDGQWQKRVMDNICTVHAKDGATQHHVECQSTPDPYLSDRYFDYDTAAAKKNKHVDENGCSFFQFPQSGVLYLRPPATLNEDTYYSLGSTRKIGEQDIRVLCPNDYSIKDLLLPNHLFMLPFFLFRYDSKLQKMNVDEKNRVLNEAEKLRNGLQNLLNIGIIDAYEERTLREMCLKVSEHIAKDDDIRKGVHRIMGGQVLDYEAKRIHDAGRVEGKAEGAYENASDTVRRMREENFSPSVIARIVGWSEEEVLALP